MAGSASTYLDKLMASPAYKVMIMSPSGVVSGYLRDDFMFDVSAEYADSSMGDRSTLNSLMDNASMLYNTFTGSEAAQMQIKSLIETRLNYSNTDKPTFSLALTFVATKPGDDVRKKIAPLWGAIAPTEAGGAALIKAPNGFGFSGTEPINSVSVKIGSWFNARRLVIVGVQPLFSKEVISSMTPLRCDLSVTFRAARMLTAPEIADFFGG